MKEIEKLLAILLIELHSIDISSDEYGKVLEHINIIKDILNIF